MFTAVLWFGSTLLLPIFLPIDKFFNLPTGSVTVLSWAGSVLADRYLDKIQETRRQSKQQELEIKPYLDLLVTFFSTLLLILAIVAIKYVFSEGS